MPPESEPPLEPGRTKFNTMTRRPYGICSMYRGPVHHCGPANGPILAAGDTNLTFCVDPVNAPSATTPPSTSTPCLHCGSRRHRCRRSPRALQSIELVSVHGDRGRDGIARRHGGLDSEAQQRSGWARWRVWEPRRPRPRGGRRGQRRADGGSGRGRDRRCARAAAKARARLQFAPVAIWAATTVEDGHG